MTKLPDKIARIAFGDIFGRGLGFLTTIYIARILGAESYGLIVIALSFLGYATWFADLGLTHIGGREIAKEPLKRIYRAREIFYLKIFLNILVLLILQITVPELDIPKEQKSIILSFSFALVPYIFILEWYYNGRQHFGKVASSKILNSTIYLLLVILFIKSPKDLLKIPWLFIAGATSSALLFTFYSIKEKPFTLPYRGWHVLKDLFKSVITVGSGTFFTQMLQLLPPIAIGFLLSAKDAGIYGAAIRIIFIAMMVDRIFVNLLLPNLSAQWVSNKEAAQHNIRFVSRIILLFGGVLSLFIAIASPAIIEIVYGSEYEASANPLSILTILLFFTFLNSLFSFGLIAIGKDKQFFYSTLFGGVTAAFLIFGAATSNKIEYVSYAVSLSEIFFTTYALYWFNKYTKLKIVAPILVTLVILSILFYFSMLTTFPLALEALVFVIIFIPLMMIFRVVDSEHVNWLKQKLSR